MPTENLWGELPAVGDLRTPLSILREQATLLSNMTERLLEGSVRVLRETPDEITAELSITAPALGGYKVAVLRISHKVAIYPVTVTDLINGDTFQGLANEDVYLDHLKTILTDPKIKSVISSLLLQSRAAS